MHLRPTSNIFHSTALLIILALAGIACSKKKERLVQETIAERVADFEKKEKAKCREALLEEAEQIVDSLLLYEALAEVQDSLKQLRPFKPLPPIAIPPIDSLRIKPIFEQ
jgi:hypothetical protein